MPMTEAPKPGLLLLHGWGFGAQIFAPSLPALQKYFEVHCASLPGYADSDPEHADPSTSQGHREPQAEAQWQRDTLKALPETFLVAAWSLGVNAAIRLMQSFPDRAIALVALNANPCFVEREDWPAAMSEQTFADFSALVADPDKLRRRFSGLLAKGNANEKSDVEYLRGLKTPPTTVLQLGLQELRRQDNREALYALRHTVFHVFAQDDVLVPIAAMDALSEKCSQHCYLSVAGGHAFFLQNKERLASLLGDCMAALSADKKGADLHADSSIDKAWLARSFSQAATSYDAAAHLQRRVGDLLLTTGVPDAVQQGVVLDLGSGTGAFTSMLASALATKLDAASARPIFSVDIAEGMLQFARAQHSDSEHFLCADAESLPLCDKSVATIYSNLALQWCDPQQSLSECWRILEPGGSLTFSTLGPDTLFELRDAWAQVDDFVHVNRFVAPEQLLGSLQNTGWQVEVFEQQRLCLQYDTFLQLAQELKALGAHNVNSGRSKGLTGRARFKQLDAAYEKFRGSSHSQSIGQPHNTCTNSRGTLPATYEVILVQVRRPGESA